MKKIILTISMFLMLASSALAQSPESMNYQAVVRDGSSNVIPNQQIGLQMTILRGSASGVVVYQETFAPTSNTYGLINYAIGTGAVVSGNFSTIDWSNGPYYIETAIDVTGGVSYVVMGTSELLSVPYALYAKTAENSLNDQVNDADADPTNELQDISLSGANLSLTSGATVDLSAINTDTQLTEAQVDAFTANNGYITSPNDADADPTNELQDISLSGANLSLTNGATVDLSAINTDTQLTEAQVDAFTANNGYITSPNDADADPTNELQTLSKTLDIVSLSNTGGSFSVNDADSNPLNELQDISLSGNNLSLTSGSTVDLSGVGFDGNFNNLTNVPIDQVNDADADPTNELQTLSKTLDIVSLSNTGGSFSVNDADSNPLNELQDISLSGNNLSLTSGSTVDLSGVGFDGQYSSLNGAPTNVSAFSNDAGYLTSFTEVDGSVTNEIQYLSLSGNYLSISGGNTVVLPLELTYVVGLNATLGGYVFYVTPDGKHGLVVSTQNQSSSSSWYEAHEAVNDPSNHNADGLKFTDWRLPSRWELNLLIGQQATIGGFADFYWSATEDTIDRSWAKSFVAGVDGNAFKTTLFYVRGVRSF